MPPPIRLTGVEDDHGDGERHQAKQLGGGEADEQAALLTVSGRWVPESALKERPEDDADTGGGSTNADGGESGADNLC